MLIHIHPCPSWRSLFDNPTEPNFLQKCRDGIWRQPNLTSSPTWLHLQILYIKIINSKSDGETDLLLAIQTKLWHRRYKNRMAFHNDGILNIRTPSSKCALINEFPSDYNTDFFCLTETWLCQDVSLHESSLPSQINAHILRDKGRGGVVDSALSINSKPTKLNHNLFKI